MVPVARRPVGISVRGGVWALVLAAFLCGAAGASVLFVGVWRHEASRVSAADVRIQEAALTLNETRAKLQKAQARLARQAELLAQLRAAAKPIVAEAGSMGAASQELAAQGAGVADSAAKLTSAVGALADYLKGTNLVDLDPAYVDTQLAELEQAVAALQGRAGKVASGSKAVAATRAKLGQRAAALAKLTK